MKSSSIELVPENLLASHKRKLYAEDKITPETIIISESDEDPAFAICNESETHPFNSSVIFWIFGSV